jgi:hypothetical protein
MSLARVSRLLALATLLSACGTSSAANSPTATRSASPTIPAHLMSPTGCAVVVGGGIGSQFSDKEVTATWDKLNSAITTELHDRLVESQYKVTKFLVPTERTRMAQDLVLSNLATSRCNRLLQVSHQVDEDASGRYFRFDVTLFRIQAKESAGSSSDAYTVTAVSEFRREYRHPRTQESFDGFYTGAFAEKVIADLTQSGSLTPLR